MKASKWVVENLIELLEQKETKEQIKEAKKVFSRYPEDHSLRKIGKEFREYEKKPAKKKKGSILRQLKEVLRTRKFEASGGSTLWFGDRRKTRRSQASR